MYISFYLDDEFYSGEVEPVETPGETQFKVDLGQALQFRLCMSVEATWASNDHVSAALIRSVGGEIERHDEGFEEEPMQPGKYYSAGVTGGQVPVIRDGEIVNEPEDVDEQSKSLTT